MSKRDIVLTGLTLERKNNFYNIVGFYIGCFQHYLLAIVGCKGNLNSIWAMGHGCGQVQYYDMPVLS